MSNYQDPSKRRSFIVTVPSWTKGGRDITLRLLREALEESIHFGMAETKAQKVVIEAVPKSFQESLTGKQP